MGDLLPYLPGQDPLPWASSQLPSNRDDVKYTFQSMESLVAHFSHLLPYPRIAAVIENEKQVFVVRKEVSLGETQLQFLKKCENTLIRTLVDLQSGRTTLDWGGQEPQEG